MVTPKNKGGDADKDVYRYTVLEYLTAELGTKRDKELNMLIKDTIAGGGLIPQLHKQLIVKKNGSAEVRGIKNISSHTESSRCNVACEAESIDLSWRVGQESKINYTGPGNDFEVDTRKDLLNTGYVQCECGESELSSIYMYQEGYIDMWEHRIHSSQKSHRIRGEGDARWCL